MAALLIGGCGSGESADTSPLPKKDPPEGVGSATKSVESSNMTPEQKQATDAYLKQGAANAQQIQRSAQGASSGPPK